MIKKFIDRFFGKIKKEEETNKIEKENNDLFNKILEEMKQDEAQSDEENKQFKAEFDKTQQENEKFSNQVKKDMKKYMDGEEIMNNCDFCSHIYSSSEETKFFKEIMGNYGVYRYLTYGYNNDEVSLVTLFLDEDPYYTKEDSVIVKYCPMCGRKLSEE